MNPLENIRVVLVDPKYGGNIGSICRVMMNMGITDLALVAPHEKLDWEEARKLAYRAEPMLDRLKKFQTLEEAVADCTVAAGTSARTGFYRDHGFTPREIAPVILDSAAHHKAALVFGREDKGLFNEEIAVCTHIINIPSSELYRSLNLSHAVMICCYELFLLAGDSSYTPPEECSPEADGKMRERLYEAWSTMMLETEFCEKEKLEHMMLGLRRIFSRGKLTVNDTRILLGIAKQTRWVAAERERLRAKNPPERPGMTALSS
jgi:TrmH family RNA methyltransferase